MFLSLQLTLTHSGFFYFFDKIGGIEMKRKNLLALALALGVGFGFVGCSQPAQGSEMQVATESEKAEEEVVSQVEEHAHGEYEWIGEFELEKGKYMLHFGASEDETMDIGFIKLGDNITDLDHHASHLMVTDKDMIEQDSTFDAKPDFAYTLEMNEDHGHIYFTIEEAGLYAIVTEHFPKESNMQIFDSNRVEILPIAEHEAHGHSH